MLAQEIIRIFNALPDEWQEKDDPLSPETVETVRKSFPTVTLSDDVKQQVLYSGQTRAIGVHLLEEAHSLTHEVAHFLLCPEERKSCDNYGLGTAFDGRIVEPVVDFETRRIEEEKASILGICLEHLLGWDIQNTLFVHNWAASEPECIADLITQVLSYIPEELRTRLDRFVETEPHTR